MRRLFCKDIHVTFSSLLKGLTWSFLIFLLVISSLIIHGYPLSNSEDPYSQSASFTNYNTRFDIVFSLEEPFIWADKPNALTLSITLNSLNINPNYTFILLKISWIALNFYIGLDADNHAFSALIYSNETEPFNIPYGGSGEVHNNFTTLVQEEMNDVWIGFYLEYVKFLNVSWVNETQSEIYSYYSPKVIGPLTFKISQTNHSTSTPPEAILVFLSLIAGISVIVLISLFLSYRYLSSMKKLG